MNLTLFFIGEKEDSELDEPVMDDTSNQDLKFDEPMRNNVVLGEFVINFYPGALILKSIRCKRRNSKIYLLKYSWFYSFFFNPWTRGVTY